MKMGTAEKPDYGIDAPEVIRNLLLVGALGLLLALSAAFHLWSGIVSIPAGGGNVLRIGLAGTGWGIAVSFAISASAMLWYSKAGKLRARERLLDLIPWRGDERVLDVGCGRGLMLIGAARRLSTGNATGVDIWQAVDLTGNRPEATLENARREGVSDRVDVETADMRRQPFADATFDVIVSCAAIHNLNRREDRAQAIEEIARVVKPDGRILIRDVRSVDEYEHVLKNRGFDVRHVDAGWKSVFVMLFTWGALRPGTLLARNAGGNRTANGSLHISQHEDAQGGEVRHRRARRRRFRFRRRRGVALTSSSSSGTAPPAAMTVAPL